MLPQIKTGVIQWVRPTQETQLTQNDGDGTESKVIDDQKALKDPASQFAIPDVPTTEAPYDGQTGFGVFHVDEDLSGG